MDITQIVFEDRKNESILNKVKKQTASYILSKRLVDFYNIGLINGGNGVCL